jgi:hypothetical protein
MNDKVTKVARGDRLTQKQEELEQLRKDVRAIVNELPELPDGLELNRERLEAMSAEQLENILRDLEKERDDTVEVQEQDDAFLRLPLSWRFAFEEWTRFDCGVGAIRRRLGLSIGASEKILRELCGDGTIRCVRQKFDCENAEPDGRWRFIRPSEWRQTEMDFEHVDDVFIGVNDDDLAYWLNAQSPEPILPKHPRDAAIIKRLKAGERPGKAGLGWKTFRENVRKDCGAKAEDRGFSDETIDDVTRKLIGELRLT